MTRFVLAVAALLLCSPALLTETALASAQNSKPDACPDTIATIGKYVNTSYGFSIVIPAGRKGMWNSARCTQDCTCTSDHGRIIPMTADGKETSHFIEAYAGFAADLEEATLDAEVEKRLDWIGERSREGSAAVQQQSEVALGSLKARRVVVRYVDKKTNRPMVEDFVAALRGRKDVDVEYSV